MSVILCTVQKPKKKAVRLLHSFILSIWTEKQKQKPENLAYVSATNAGGSMVS